MSERYSKVFSLPGNLYAEGAPVIISAGNLLKDNQTGKVLAQLKIKNISPRTLRAAKVLIRMLDTTGQPLNEDAEKLYLDLSAGQGEEFGQKEAIALPNASARRMRAEVIYAAFSDDSTWEGSDSAWEPLPLSERLDRKLGDPELVKQFRLRFGGRCAFFPQEHKDLWLCSCGEWNKGETCRVCRQEKAPQLALDLDELKAEKDARLEKEKAESEAKAIEKKKKQEQSAATTKKIIKAALLFAAAACLCVAAFMILTKAIIPNKQYKEACKVLEAGKYEEASAAFVKLGDYKDSREMALEAQRASDYNRAQILLEKSEYRAAIDAFDLLKGYRDSETRAYEARKALYEQAITLFNSGELDKAIAIFKDLGPYKDSAEQIEKAEYEKLLIPYRAAMESFNQKRYDEAQKQFSKLGDFEDSEAMYKESIYLEACQKLSEGINNAAYTDFFRVKDYKDSKERLRSCVTRSGQICYLGHNGETEIEWTVLKVEDGCALLISREPVGVHSYNDKRARGTWANSGLRKWLNGEYYDSAFSEEEKNAIRLTTVVTPPFYYQGKVEASGGPTTKDKLFVLSLDEIEEFGGTGSNSSIRKIIPDSSWLRTPGIRGQLQVTVSYNSLGPYVFVNTDGYDETISGNVHAVMWISTIG